MKESVNTLAGKYMTFRLAREVYGIGILSVRELIGLMEITRVPGAPGFMRGVINLRGKIIPVVDLRSKFRMDAAAPTDQTVIIVVQLQLAGGLATVGILVDEVLEVAEISADQIEPPPSFGGPLEGDYLLGVGKAERRVVFLLDIDEIFTAREKSAVAQVAV